MPYLPLLQRFLQHYGIRVYTALQPPSNCLAWIKSQIQKRKKEKTSAFSDFCWCQPSLLTTEKHAKRQQQCRRQCAKTKALYTRTYVCMFVPSNWSNLPNLHTYEYVCVKVQGKKSKQWQCHLQLLLGTEAHFNRAKTVVACHTHVIENVC